MRWTAIARAPARRFVPSFSSSARARVATPRRKEQSGGGPTRLPFAGRDFIAPRSRLPYSRSHSSSVGNAARRLSFSGSPAYTPDTNGATRYSRISCPNFRRTKSATDSSFGGGRVFRNGSEAIFHREPGVSMEEVSSARGDIGISCNLPRIRT